MKPLSRTLRERRGDPLPCPWPSLSEMADTRQGDAITVLGAPMSNKSNLLLNWLLRTDTPAIFGTFDTPIRDMTARSLAILSGDPIDTVSEGMPLGRYDQYADAQTKLWFMDDSSCLVPDHEGKTLMDDLFMAYEEFLGEPPKVIVLDNLSDCADDVHHVELQRAFKAARAIGARLNATVFALHHVRRPGSDESKDPASVPVRLNDGVFAGERDAATVLGLWKPKVGEGRVLRVAHLKSKRKEANPAGGMYLDFDLAETHAYIGEQEKGEE